MFTTVQAGVAQTQLLGRIHPLVSYKCVQSVSNPGDVLGLGFLFVFSECFTGLKNKSRTPSPNTQGFFFSDEGKIPA